jgi:hypothetical protein
MSGGIGRVVQSIANRGGRQELEMLAIVDGRYLNLLHSLVATTILLMAGNSNYAVHFGCSDSAAVQVVAKFDPIQSVRFCTMSKKDVFRVVTRATDGTLRIRDFPNPSPLLEMHTQIGIEDSSTDLELRGMPVFRGLIGPIPEGRNIVRYETPEVFETITKEWSASKIKRRRRRVIPSTDLAAGEPLADQAPATV